MKKLHKTIEIQFKKINSQKNYEYLKNHKGIEIIDEKTNFLKIKVEFKDYKITNVVRDLLEILDVIDISVHEPRLEYIIKEIYNNGINNSKN
jgi:ABC-type uncharacterized transport system ATPase subunit